MTNGTKSAATGPAGAAAPRATPRWLLGAALAAVVGLAGPAGGALAQSVPANTAPAAPADKAAAAPEAPASPAATAAPAAGTPAAADQPATDQTQPAGAASPQSAPAPEPAGTPTPKGPVVVASWGGVYSKSQNEAIYRPFTRATGIEVSSKVYSGDLDQIRKQVEGGKVMWDVVDVEPADARQGCDEGLFEKLSIVLAAAPDGTAATDDFLPGTLQPCAVGSVAWSVAIAYDVGRHGDRAGDARPQSLRDFFDLTDFPGKRGLRRTPMVNLEWALLADGVAPAEVYDLLRTPAGVDRAFAKLDTIKDSIVWWQDAGEPEKLLADGSVAMTSTYNAPMFIAIAMRQQPFAMIWDRQIWDIDLWAVPSGAPDREAALEFIRFATGTDPLARQTRWIPYGPVRRSALSEVGAFALADGVDVAPYLPTAPDNLATALRNDASFWRENGPALVERFNAWLAQ